jgi:hypothetical protein
MRTDGRIPQEIINDVFGLSSKIVTKQFETEEATYLDPDWQELKKAYLTDDQNKELRDRFLRGDKMKDILSDIAMKEKVSEDSKPVEEKPSRPKPLKDLMDTKAPAGGPMKGPSLGPPPGKPEEAKPGAGAPEEKEKLPVTPGAEGPAV